MTISLHPIDEHNSRLVQNVHPQDWQNPTPRKKYNLVVIGAGTAGLVAASAASQLGAKVALIERELMGGDCLNVGCVPSKAVIAPAKVASLCQNSQAMGIQVDSISVKFSQVMERMRRLRADISHHDSAKRFSDLGVDVFLGEGRFIDPSTIEVAGLKLKFSKALIATGARAVAPSIPGLDQIHYLTNESIFSLTKLPRRFGVIGGGPIGCEMAQAFARLGSQVTLIDRADRLLSREEPDASKIIESTFEEDAIRLVFNAERLEFTPKQDDTIVLKVHTKGQHLSLEFDQVLIAAGRQPNVEQLNLEAAGVEYDTSEGVKVSDSLRTSNRRVFAAGDVCSKFQFTHAADFMARIVLRNALFLGRGKLSQLTIPWCTYTSPEVAHVGDYPGDSKNEVDSFELSLASVDRAVLEGQTEGFVRVHVKKGTSKIVGATIVAENAGDMISQISMAMTHGLKLGAIANTIFPYPTQAEAIRKVGDQYNKTRLTPLVKKLMGWWLSWNR